MLFDEQTGHIIGEFRSFMTKDDLIQTYNLSANDLPVKTEFTHDIESLKYNPMYTVSMYTLHLYASAKHRIIASIRGIIIFFESIFIPFQKRYNKPRIYIYT